MFSTRFPAPMESLRAGLAELAAVDAVTLTDDELLAYAAEVEELGRLIDAARVVAAGEVADRSRPASGEDRLSARRGCRNAGELLERVTRVAGATARARVRAAVPLRSRVGLTGEDLPAAFPVIAEAFTAGRIGLDTVTTILACLAPVVDRGVCAPEAVTAAEQALVDAATGEGDAIPAAADEVAVMAKVWALALDPDGTLPDEHDAFAARGVTLGKQKDGVVPIHGALLPEGAAQLHLLFDAYLNPKASPPHFTPDSGPDDDDAAYESSPGGAEFADERTPAQRRHDALVAVLMVAAGADGVPRLGGAAPILVVTTTAEQMADSSGVAFLPTRGDGDAGAVSAAVARQVACAGAVQRVVFDPLGRILTLGAPQRLFTAHQRRAIAARDGECIIPGCHVPAAWCEIHHVIPAARGGPTHTDNGVPVCGFHHRTIDTSGWEIRMLRGVPWIRPPAWLDHTRRWRPARPSPQRHHATLTTAHPRP